MGQGNEIVNFPSFSGFSLSGAGGLLGLVKGRRCPKTGRPRDCTMEMNGGSAASYLAHTLCVPVFLLVLIIRGLKAKGFLDFQGRRRITSVVRCNLRPVIFGVEIHSRPHHPNTVGAEKDYIYWNICGS